MDLNCSIHEHMYIHIYGKFVKILGSSQKSYPPNIRLSSSCCGGSFPEMMLKKNSSLSNVYNFTFSKHSTRWSSKNDLLIECDFFFCWKFMKCVKLCVLIGCRIPIIREFNQHLLLFQWKTRTSCMRTKENEMAMLIRVNMRLNCSR